MPPRRKKKEAAVEVTPGVYLGDKVAAKDKALLKRLGVKSVVNCTPPKSEDKTAGGPPRGTCPRRASSARSVRHARRAAAENTTGLTSAAMLAREGR